METTSAEYQLLEIYHRKRKSRLSATPRHPTVFQGPVEDYQLRLVSIARLCASAKTNEFDQVAERLTHIVDSELPAQEHVETDNDSAVIHRFVDLLKEYGDQMNEKIKNDEELLGYLQGLLSYNLFETLASAFINSVVPPGNQRKEDNDQKLKIAWTFEMTSRLSAIDLQPMNRAMGFGAQYVHQHFAPWIQQRGGWENAFNINDGDDEVQ
ncbi:apoptosis facilitator Bcl-2-like protein 14 isoform 2-T2 [Clarias gariepinus]|uniref:apoptosis facilitator Bcl-2-like protein 14 isoform X2 n=1 Tax=Clarias gariepinus TaxID=13013 RepID=UPI00234DB179|nr:apoptosis facilitator Bcl-2-like protein 14 isoform X2 [Clarias gariepinus]